MSWRWCLGRYTHRAELICQPQYINYTLVSTVTITKDVCFFGCVDEVRAASTKRRRRKAKFGKKSP